MHAWYNATDLYAYVSCTFRLFLTSFVYFFSKTFVNVHFATLQQRISLLLCNFAGVASFQHSKVSPIGLRLFWCLYTKLQSDYNKNSKTRSSLGRFGLFPWCKVATKKCTRAQLHIFHLFPSCKIAKWTFKTFLVVILFVVQKKPLAPTALANK